MISLLIGVGVMFLAIVVSTMIDPWPPRTGDEDDAALRMSAIVLSV